MEKEKEKLIFIQSDREWNDSFRRLQAMYDCREEKRRRPSLAPLVAVVGLLTLVVGGAALALGLS